MDQSVMTFADSAARGSAIPSPTEGMVTYLDDTDALEVFNGTSFVPAAPASGGGSGNAIINGAFEINQRGFTSSTANDAYGFDRWTTFLSDGTTTYSSQDFTLGAAPEAGYEAKSFARLVTTGQTLSSASSWLRQKIESVRTFAGQTVTVSFWAKAGSGTPNIAVELSQIFGPSGSGASAVVNTYAGQVTLSTSWARHSVTVAVPSISGKTITTLDNLSLNLMVSAGTDFNARSGSLGIQSNTFDIWGVQVEAGSTATEFRRNANSLQGELAACQRYYWRSENGALAGAYSRQGNGPAHSSTAATPAIVLPVSMRARPTSVEFSNLSLNQHIGTAHITITSLTLNNDLSNNLLASVNAVVSSGLSTGTRYDLHYNNSTAGFIGFSAEL
jgi:hypothetical protein